MKPAASQYAGVVHSASLKVYMVVPIVQPDVPEFDVEPTSVPAKSEPVSAIVCVLSNFMPVSAFGSHAN